MINDKGEEVGIIYGWYNTKSGKWYVGQTVNPEGRFNCHIDRAINKKDKTYFYNSIRKYGLENFVYCVLEENVLRENLNMREMDWIEEFDSFYSGYNLTLGGDGSKGFIMPEEQKKKISQSNKGKTPWNKGKHDIFSEESRKRISNKFKGKPLSEEHKKKISEANKGKTFSIEARKKMSESRKGRNYHSIERKVSQYDLNGNYIKTYNSIKEAKYNSKCGNIIAVCRGYRRQSGGFIWKYAS